jgi:hypothetical protein
VEGLYALTKTNLDPEAILYDALASNDAAGEDGVSSHKERGVCDADHKIISQANLVCFGAKLPKTDPAKPLSIPRCILAEISEPTTCPYALAIRSDCHASTRVTRAERAVIRGPKDGVVVGPMKWTGRSGETLRAVVGCANLP